MTATTTTCSLCSGTGKIREGNVTCPDCQGTGQVATEAESKSRRARVRRQTRSLALGREYRHFTPRNFHFRAATGSAGQPDTNVVVTGDAIIYDTWYSVPDWFGSFQERIMPGALAGCLARGVNVGLFVNHDIQAIPLASTASGTLTLNDGPTALGITATIDTRMTVANDLMIAMERGDLTQMSVGFEVDPGAGGMDAWDWTGNMEYRTITAMSDFFDVSAVTWPCSTTTSIALAQRSLVAMPPESRARLSRAYGFAKELREGKVLSQANGQLLMDALEALHQADDVDIPSIVEGLQTIDAALDAGQAGLSQVLDTADPDGDPDDLEPALVPPPGDTEAAEARSRELALLELERERLALRARA